MLPETIKRSYYADETVLPPSTIGSAEREISKKRKIWIG